MSNNRNIFGRLKSGAILVVPDATYAFNLKQQYEIWTLETTNVWPTPTIYSWQGWLKNLWVQQGLLKNDCRIVLNGLQQRLLWQRVIENDIDENESAILWNQNASIQQAKSAWSLVHNYCLDLVKYPYVVNDFRVYKRWHQAYCESLDQNEWLDPHQLAEQLISKNLQLPPQSTDFFGFDKFTPLQNRFFTKVFRQSVSSLNFDTGSPGSISVFEYVDMREEMTACSKWARDKYESDPLCNIGVVVADLEHKAIEVDGIFKSTFVPDYALDVNQSDVFKSTLNSRLVDKGLIDSALNILGLLVYRFNYHVFSRFLRDTFINRDDQLKHDLCLLDVKLHSIVTHDLSLIDAIAMLNRIQDQGEIDIGFTIRQLQSLLSLTTTFEKKTSIAHWCDHFSKVLKMFKWPDQQLLNHVEKQQFKQWEQLLANVCTAGLVCRQLSVTEAIALFKQTAASTESQARQTGITIVDLDKCVGMHFDAVWICGLSDAVLPAAIKFNPLLPFQLQRDQVLPFSTSPDCQQRAQQRFDQLTLLADEIRISYYKNDENLTYRQSGLLDKFPVKTIEQIKALKPEADERAGLETYNDDFGLPVNDDTAPGGSYLLKSQAQCPFKAYAENRLAVYPIEQRDIGLDAAQRGTLVHQLLQKIWQKLKSSSGLKDLSEQALEELVRLEIDTVIKPLGFSYELFVEIEARRLKQLVHEWLNLEKTRMQDFTVKSLELPLSFSCSGIEFNLKVDRIDELEDGSLVIIDYKTGEASKSLWLDPRVQDPQMPIYFFALGETVTAICFANIKSPGFDGLSKTDVGIKGISQVEKSNRGKLKNYEDFTLLSRHWRQVITDLVHEYKQGYASVTPESVNYCKYCCRQSLCRLNQHQLASKPEND